MVSLINSSEPIFAGQLSALRNFIVSFGAQQSPEIAFAARVLRSCHFDSLSTTAATIEENRLSQAPMLAATGYLFEYESSSDDLKTAWLAAFSRLTRRDPFPSDRSSFFYRPVELLGVCIGARILNPPASEQLWLQNTLLEGQSKVSTQDLWSTVITMCAAFESSTNWPSAALSRIDDMDTLELALLNWVCKTYPNIADKLSVQEKKAQLEKQLLKKIALTTLAPGDVCQAAIIYYSARQAVDQYVESAVASYWQIGRQQIDSIALLTNLFSRFHLFARQLLERHNTRQTIGVTDEYDVQDLVHALLKLHFDDIRPEECTPSYAGTGSRTDFLLKREQIMIEVKMTRKNLGQKEVTNQLIIDRERYKTHQDCKHLVCFVYDPGNMIENPHAVEADVAQNDKGQLPVTVIVAPKGL